MTNKTPRFAAPRDGDSSYREAWTVADVAAYFRRSVRTINRWVEQGVIPQPRKVMGSRYWYRGEVERFLETSREGKK